MNKLLLMLPLVLGLIACSDDRSERFDRAIEGALKAARTDEQRQAILNAKKNSDHFSDEKRDRFIEAWEKLEKTQAEFEEASKACRAQPLCSQANGED